MIGNFGGTEMFQFTPPCGGQLSHDGRKENEIKVSIHAPVRGATPPRRTGTIYYLFQFTPPCGGQRLVGRHV